MTLEMKQEFIQKKLDEFFPNPPIPLDYQDAFTLLIAVLLSAQCTDVRVNQVTPILFAKANNPHQMAKMNVDEIEEIIRPCGLSKNKSKAISRLSEILVEEYDGTVPNTMEELEKLPGVGHKTASVIMIQAFDLPAFPVDTHIQRLAERWGLSDGKSVTKTESDLKAIFPESTWAKLHLQMIWFGRTYCKARGHIDQECPICCKIK